MPPLKPKRLTAHLCRSMIVDFRAVSAAEAAEMLRNSPEGAERAALVAAMTPDTWTSVLEQVADALKPSLRAIDAKHVETLLYAAIDGAAKGGR